MHCYSYDWFGLVSNVRLLFVGSHFIRKTPLLLFRSTNSCPSATTDMPQGKSEERATPKYLHCPWMMAMLLILVLESEIMCFDNIMFMCFTWDDVLGDGRGWLLCFGWAQKYLVSDSYVDTHSVQPKFEKILNPTWIHTNILWFFEGNWPYFLNSFLSQYGTSAYLIIRVFTLCFVLFVYVTFPKSYFCALFYAHNWGKGIHTHH